MHLQPVHESVEEQIEDEELPPEGMGITGIRRALILVHTDIAAASN